MQSVGSLHVKNFILFKPRSQSLQASGNVCFLVLSTPEPYCSRNLRSEGEDMSYSHIYWHSISQRSLWRERKSQCHRKSMGMQEMKCLPKSCTEVHNRA